MRSAVYTDPVTQRCESGEQELGCFGQHRRATCYRSAAPGQSRQGSHGSKDSLNAGMPPSLPEAPSRLLRRHPPQEADAAGAAHGEHVALWRWLGGVAREPAAGAVASDEVGQLGEEHGATGLTLGAGESVSRF